MYVARDFLTNLALVLGVAALTTIISQRLRLPVVFGYMLAGLIVGPHLAIPLVADEPTVRVLSELGVVLLMFSLGLEFSLRRLLRAGWQILIVALLECSFMLWLGYSVGRLSGWSVLESIYAGGIIAISSTTIILKAFADRGVRGSFTDLVFGILIVEDLIAILLLALLTPASSGHGLAAGPILGMVLRLVAFLAALLIVGILIVPRLVRFVVRLQRPETTLVACVGICFGTALLARSIGYSVALGAFLAGSLVAESGEEKAVERLIEPLRDMFAAIFFVSVGMLIDPELVARHWSTVVLFTLLVVVGKTLAVSVSSFLTGASTRTAVRTGMSLAQIGEFSFIIAAVGVATGGTRPFLYPIAVAVSALTTLLTPWLIRAADPVSSYLDRHLPRTLQTFVGFYGSWIESLRGRPPIPEERKRVRRAVQMLLIDAAVVVAVILVAAAEMDAVSGWLSGRMGVSVDAARGGVFVASVLLASPFCVGMVRTAGALGQALAARAFTNPEKGKLDLAAAPRRAMIVTIQLATVLIIGAPLAAIAEPLLPAPYAVAVLASVLLVLGIAFWRSAANLRGHVRAGAEVLVSALAQQTRSGEGSDTRALDQAYQLTPGLGSPIPIRIDETNRMVGLTLADLEMRGRTGATVVAILRGESVILVPDGHETLRAGDVLALAGTSESVEAAKSLLAEG
jgi:CPA2 family monovalent cation:H+ antiporter-2